LEKIKYFIFYLLTFSQYNSNLYSMHCSSAKKDRFFIVAGVAQR